MTSSEASKQSAFNFNLGSLQRGSVALHFAAYPDPCVGAKDGGGFSGGTSGC